MGVKIWRGRECVSRLRVGDEGRGGGARVKKKIKQKSKGAGPTWCIRGDGESWGRQERMEKHIHRHSGYCSPYLVALTPARPRVSMRNRRVGDGERGRDAGRTRGKRLDGKDGDKTHGKNGRGVVSHDSRWSELFPRGIKNRERDTYTRMPRVYLTIVEATHLYALVMAHHPELAVVRDSCHLFFSCRKAASFFFRDANRRALYYNKYSFETK